MRYSKIFLPTVRFKDSNISLSAKDTGVKGELISIGEISNIIEQITLMKRKAMAASVNEAHVVVYGCSHDTKVLRR